MQIGTYAEERVKTVIQSFDGPFTAHDLAAKLGVDPQSITSRLPAYEELGWLTKDGDMYVKDEIRFLTEQQARERVAAGTR